MSTSYEDSPSQASSPTQEQNAYSFLRILEEQEPMLKKRPGFEHIDIKAAVQFFQNRRHIAPAEKEAPNDGAAFGKSTLTNGTRYY